MRPGRTLFRRRGDDLVVKLSRHRLDDRSIDALLSGRAVSGEPDLAAFVARVRALPPESPLPSGELAAMLEHGVPPEVLDRSPVLLPAPAHRAVSWRYALVSLAAGVTAVVGAGAANALPAPAQRAVADVVNWVTPLELPKPDADEDSPAVAPTRTPSPEPSSSSHETSRPAPGVSSTPDDGDGDDDPDVRESPSGSDGDDDSDSRSPEPRSTSSSDSDDGSPDDGATPTPTSDSDSDDSSSSGSGSSGSGSSSLGATTDDPES